MMMNDFGFLANLVPAAVSGLFFSSGASSEPVVPDLPRLVESANRVELLCNLCDLNNSALPRQTINISDLSYISPLDKIHADDLQIMQAEAQLYCNFKTLSKVDAWTDVLADSDTVDIAEQQHIIPYCKYYVAQSALFSSLIELVRSRYEQAAQPPQEIIHAMVSKYMPEFVSGFNYYVEAVNLDLFADEKERDALCEDMVQMINIGYIKLLPTNSTLMAEKLAALLPVHLAEKLKTYNVYTHYKDDAEDVDRLIDGYKLALLNKDTSKKFEQSLGVYSLAKEQENQTSLARKIAKGAAANKKEIDKKVCEKFVIAYHMFCDVQQTNDLDPVLAKKTCYFINLLSQKIPDYVFDKNAPTKFLHNVKPVQEEPKTEDIIQENYIGLALLP